MDEGRVKPVNTYIIGDMHFGHKNIGNFRGLESMEENEERLCDGWQDTVKRETDKVWVLGDAAFTIEGLIKIHGLRGRKFLTRGNHDMLSTKLLAVAFEEIYGIFKYKKSKHLGAWLSHAPIHPHELRGCINIHGHVHYKSIREGDLLDPRYVNVCPERIGYAPVLLRELLQKRT